jgi:hypothetical protein
MIRLARRPALLALSAAMALSGLILVVRAAIGPFPQVHSPLNAEGCFGLSAVLLLVLRAIPGALDRKRFRWTRWDLLAMTSLAGIIAAVFWRSARDYFLSDDFVIIDHARTWQFGLRRVFATPGGDGFFRPLTYASYALTLHWTGLDPLRWHIVGFALHMACAVLVLLLARRLGLSRSLAWLAAALFAVHGSRPEAALWITGRFDLLATMFVLGALVLFCAAWQPGRPALLWLSVAAMVCGILCKESAYACPLLMVLILWALGGEIPLRRRVRLLAPFFAVSAALFAYRFVLFHGIGGYVTASGQPQVFHVRFIAVVNALAVRLWAVLFFPIDWAVPAGVLLAVAIAAYVAALFWMTFAAAPRRDLLLAIGFVLIAAAPPVQQLLIGPDLEKARYLYLPSAGFCLLIAYAAACMRPRARWIVCGTVLAFQTVALVSNLQAWDYAAAKARPACDAAASCVRGPVLAVGLPRILNGAYFFQNGFPECVRMASGRATLSVKLSDSPPSPAEAARYGCVLTWNPEKAELESGR